MRKYAPLYNNENRKWGVIAKDDLNSYWFVYLTLNASNREEAEGIAYALNLGERAK